MPGALEDLEASLGPPTVSGITTIPRPRLIKGGGLASDPFEAAAARLAAKHPTWSPDYTRRQIKQESGGSSAATSPKGAMGAAQVMPATAARFGYSPQDMRDPTKAADVYERYMDFLLKRYGGDPEKALAGYNAGEGNVDKFGGIPPFAETQNYIRSILGHLPPKAGQGQGVVHGAITTRGQGALDALEASLGPPTLPRPASQQQASQPASVGVAKAQPEVNWGKDQSLTRDFATGWGLQGLSGGVKLAGNYLDVIGRYHPAVLASNAITGTKNPIGSWIQGKGEALRSLASSMQEDTAAYRQHHQPTSFVGQVEQNVAMGAGAAVPTLTRLAAGSYVLGPANLPLQFGLERADEGPLAAARGVAEGAFYHFGMGFTAPLGRIANALIWGGAAAAQSTAEQALTKGKVDPAEVVGQGITMGGLSAMGGTRVRVLDPETGMLRNAMVRDLPAINRGKLKPIPPAYVQDQLKAAGVDPRQLTAPTKPIPQTGKGLVPMASSTEPGALDSPAATTPEQTLGIVEPTKSEAPPAPNGGNPSAVYKGRTFTKEGGQWFAIQGQEKLPVIYGKTIEILDKMTAQAESPALPPQPTQPAGLAELPAEPRTDLTITEQVAQGLIKPADRSIPTVPDPSENDWVDITPEEHAQNVAELELDHQIQQQGNAQAQPEVADQTLKDRIAAFDPEALAKRGAPELKDWMNRAGLPLPKGGSKAKMAAALREWAGPPMDKAGQMSDLVTGKGEPLPIPPRRPVALGEPTPTPVEPLAATIVPPSDEARLTQARRDIGNLQINFKNNPADIPYTELKRLAKEAGITLPRRGNKLGLFSKLANWAEQTDPALQGRGNVVPTPIEPQPSLVEHEAADDLWEKVLPSFTREEAHAAYERAKIDPNFRDKLGELAAADQRSQRASQRVEAGKYEYTENQDEEDGISAASADDEFGAQQHEFRQLFEQKPQAEPQAEPRYRVVRGADAYILEDTQTPGVRGNKTVQVGRDRAILDQRAAELNRAELRQGPVAPKEIEDAVLSIAHGLPHDIDPALAKSLQEAGVAIRDKDGNWTLTTWGKRVATEGPIVEKGLGLPITKLPTVLRGIYANHVPQELKDMVAGLRGLINPSGAAQRLNRRGWLLEKLRAGTVGEQSYNHDVVLGAFKKALSGLTPDQHIDLMDSIKLGRRPGQAGPEQAFYDYATKASDEAYVAENEANMLWNKRSEAALMRVPPSKRLAFFRELSAADQQGRAPSFPSDPQLAYAARQVPKHVRARLLDYIENHFRVSYTQSGPAGPGQAAAAQAKQSLRGGSLGGTKGQYRQMKYQTVADAIGAGLQPTTTNAPEQLQMALTDSVKAATMAEMVARQRRIPGQTVFVKARNLPSNLSKGNVPDGYAIVNDRAFFRAVRDKMGVHPMGAWAVQEDVARMLNNYKSTDYIRGGWKGAPITNALLQAKMRYTELELALSGFHYSFVNMAANAHLAGIATREAMLGMKGRAAKDLAISSLGAAGSPAVLPFGAGAPNLPRGLRMPGSYYSLGRASILGEREDLLTGEGLAQPGDLLSPKDRAALDQMYPGQVDRYVRLSHEAGLKPGLAEDYRTGAMSRAKEAWASLKVDKDMRTLGKLGINVPFAGIEKAMAPLFENYIPAIKRGAFFKDLHLTLMEKGADLASGKVTELEVAHEVAQRTENLFGEMNFDNLYWNRTFKSTAQMLVRSVTWQLGTLKVAGQGIKGLGESSLSAVTFGRQGTSLANSAFKAQAAQLLGIALTGAISGSVISKVTTGMWPWQWANRGKTVLERAENEVYNFIFPHVSKEDPEQRISQPSYLKPMVGMAHATAVGRFHLPTAYLGSSGSGLLSKAVDVWNNKDFYGTEIADPRSSKVAQAINLGRHLLPTPFGITSYQRLKGQGEGTLKSAALSGLGLTYAPSYITQSPAEQEMYSLLQSERQQGAQSAGQAAKLREKSRLENLIRRGKTSEAVAELQEQLRSGELGPEQAKQIWHTSRLDRLQSNFSRLRLETGDVFSVWNKMDDSEKQQVAPIFFKKLRNNWPRLAPVDRERLQPAYQEALGGLPPMPQRPTPTGVASP